jgi:TolC family type I secretion outer membrane protein
MKRSVAVTVALAAIALHAPPVHSQTDDGGDPFGGKMLEEVPTLPVELADRFAPARVTTVDTFADAIALAYARNPGLLAERATARATDNRLPAARGAYGPRLDLQGFQAFQQDRTELPLPLGWTRNQGWTTTAQAVISQPVFTFGRLRSAEEEARAQIDFAHANLRFTESDVLFNTISAYVAVQRDDAIVAVTRENLALLETELADNRERFRVREITSSDLQQVETRVEFGRAQLISAEGAAANSRAAFLRFVGALPGDLAAVPRLRVPVASLDQAASAAEANNPLIAAAQARERIARAAIAAANAEFLPRIDARGSGAYGTRSPYNNDPRTTQLRGELALTVPLADAGVRDANLRAAREAQDAEWRLIDQTTRDVRELAAGAWNSLVSSRLSLARYAAAVEAAERAYEGAALQERAGARTTLDVLDLARDLLSVRRAYVEAIANEYLSRAALLAAIGGLEGRNLLPEPWLYDANSNRSRVERSGDIPLFTDLLSTLDGIAVGDMRTDQPSRDFADDLMPPDFGPLPADEVPSIQSAAPAPAAG